MDVTVSSWIPYRADVDYFSLYLLSLDEQVRCIVVFMYPLLQCIGIYYDCRIFCHAVE